MTTAVWRADLDRALEALQAVRQMADSDVADTSSGPAADALMAALCALEASRAARTGQLVAALTAHALRQGATWELLDYPFDPYD